MSDTENIYTAVAKAMETVDNPPMNGRGNYGYYVLLSDLANAVRKPFAAQGLAFHHDIEADDERVAVTCIITHSSGEEMRVGPVWSARGTNVQHLMGATTYLRRLTLQSATGLAGEEDDDGQNHSDQVTHTPNPRGLRGPAARDLATPITIPQTKKLAYEMRKANVTEATLSDFAKTELGFELPVDGITHLTKGQATVLIDAMTKVTAREQSRIDRDQVAEDPWQEPPVDESAAGDDYEAGNRG